MNDINEIKKHNDDIKKQIQELQDKIVLINKCSCCEKEEQTDKKDYGYICQECQNEQEENIYLIEMTTPSEKDQKDFDEYVDSNNLRNEYIKFDYNLVTETHKEIPQKTDIISFYKDNKRVFWIDFINGKFIVKGKFKVRNRFNDLKPLKHFKPDTFSRSEYTEFDILGEE